MGTYYPFDDDLRNCLWYTRMPYASCALRLRRFRCKCALKGIFRLKTHNRLLYYLAFRPIGWKYSCLPSDNVPFTVSRTHFVLPNLRQNNREQLLAFSTLLRKMSWHHLLLPNSEWIIRSHFADNIQFPSCKNSSKSFAHSCARVSIVVQNYPLWSSNRSGERRLFILWFTGHLILCRSLEPDFYQSFIYKWIVSFPTR